LKLLRHLEKYVTKAAKVAIPFNNYITGSTAFTHKAGVHSKASGNRRCCMVGGKDGPLANGALNMLQAVMSDPAAYEVIDPAEFGVERHIEVSRARQALGSLRVWGEPLRARRDGTGQARPGVPDLLSAAADCTPLDGLECLASAGQRS
jgi:homocitrate synthase